MAETLPIVAFVVLALLLGGAGLSYPLLSWLILLSAAVVLWVVLARTAWSDMSIVARFGIGLAGGLILLLALQAAPLPTSVWLNMPGHAVAAQIVQAANVEPWAAWSLAPDRTLQVMLSVLVPLASLLAMAASSHARRLLVLRIVIAFAAFNAVLGVIQFAAGSAAAPLLFETRHRGVAVGLFVNRNHLAVFLLVSMLLAVLPGVVRFSRQTPRKAVLTIRAMAVALLGLGVVATMSRAGLALLPLVLLAAVLLMRERKPSARTLVIGAAAVALFAGLFSLSQPALQLAARFEAAGDDKRFDYWTNTALLAREALPMGTGFSTFQLVYPTAEPLNQVAPDVVNRAHDDFLEAVLEGGVPAAILIALALGLAALAVIRARRVAQTRFDRLAPLAVAAGVLVLAAASLVDYPVRMEAIAMLAGLLLGLIAPEPVPSSPGTPVSKLALFGLALVLGAGCVWATMVSWSDHFRLSGQPEQAVAINPASSQAWSALATKREIAGDAGGSSAAARKALARSPLDAAALRAEGAAQIQLGKAEQGAALLSLGARLGWRDVYTQLWLAEQALAAGADQFAVQRADAVLRQNRFFEQVMRQLPPLITRKSGRDALAEQLSYRPGWRPAFFNEVARAKSLRIDDVLALLAALRSRGSGAAPEETALIRAVLADDGRFADAMRVWRASGGVGNVGDPGFERASQIPRSAAPFAWKAPELLGVRVQVGTPSPALAGQALALSSDGEAAGAALVQTIALPPGRYRISVSALTAKPDLLTKLEVGLACRTAGSAPASPPITAAMSWKRATGDWLTGTASIDVLRDCPGQDLYLAVPRTDAEPFSVWIDKIDVKSTDIAPT